MYKAGDIVYITEVASESWSTQAWIGTRHTVIQDQLPGSIFVVLRPFHPRPDGHGWADFHWRAHRISKTPPADAKVVNDLSASVLILDHAAVLSQQVKYGVLSEADDFINVFTDFLSDYQKLEK